jgi:hypothetical protein
MTRDPMSAELATLERSLRAGPPDEAGYAGGRLEFDVLAGADVNAVHAPRRVSPTLRMRQRRATSFAPGLAMLLVAVVTLGAIAALTRSGPFGTGTPTPSAVSSPVPIPTLDATFVSPRNGFSISYPGDWAVTPATTSWRLGTYAPAGNSAVDELSRPGRARLVVASQRLGAGQTRVAWLASFVHPFAFSASCTNDSTAWPRITIDGQPGYLDLAACPIPVDTYISTPDVQFEALVFAGGRVYQIALDGIVDRTYFEAILATIHLDPASALDPPTPS